MKIGEVNPGKARDFVASWKIYAGDVSNPLWMEPSELRGLKERNLRRQLELAARFSPYYRELFRREGVEVEKVRTLSDLERIPVTPREAFLERPFSFLLGIQPPDTLDLTYEITYTSGTTTGTPAPFFNTTYDMYRISLQMRRTAEISWMTPRDTVLNLFPFGTLPHIGFYRTVHLASTVGMRLVNSLVGRDRPGFPVHRTLDEALELAALHGVTVLSGTGRQERRFVLRGAQLGADLSGLRIILAMGEAVTEGMRDEMRANLPGEASRAFINNGYGFTECQGTFVECCEMGGNHNPAPDLYHLEILDPETLRPLPDGEVGRLAVTHLDRRGTVLLRYLVGDLAAMEEGPCPHCGRSGGRLVIRVGSSYAVREERVIRVGGRLVNPEAVHNQMAGIKGVVEYQLVVEKEDPADRLSPDVLTIRLSVAGRLRQDLEREIVAKIREAAGITPRISYVQTPEIYDPSRMLKATRILDMREAGGPQAD